MGRLSHDVGQHSRVMHSATAGTHFSASGITILFILSYGAGIPSKAFSRSNAAAPRFVLCGIILQATQQQHKNITSKAE
jgi:hypothetical protein